jgi:hypothetical protein
LPSAELNDVTGLRQLSGQGPPWHVLGVLLATSAVRRPYGRIGAFLVTALLMLASFFTISSILASADLAPLEAWLLPLAFGPVFVLATKIAVGAWLSSAQADRLPTPTHHLTSWIVGPVPGLRLTGTGRRSGAEERCSRLADAAAGLG